MKLGVLLPAILVITAVVDVAGRFLPIDALSYRGWEAVSRYPWAVGPFTPNARYRSDKTRGDLPTLGNISGFTDVHEERFEIDSQGFRTNGRAPDLPWGAILAGDSFTAGLTFNDENTLPSELERRCGVGIFNAGLMPVKSGNILNIAQRIGLSSGSVVYVYMERQPFPRPREVSGISNEHRYGAGDSWSRGRITQVVAHAWNGFWRITPVEILCRRVYRRFQDGRIFPNPFRDKVEIGVLKNGARMLLWAKDVHSNHPAKRLDASGVSKLRSDLAAHNLRLSVVLVPTKYTVYRPLLKEDTGVNTGERYLAELEKLLRAENIPVVNVTEPLMAKAREELEAGRYIYWLEDSHWNARGLEVTADEIAKAGLIR